MDYYIISNAGTHSSKNGFLISLFILISAAVQHSLKTKLVESQSLLLHLRWFWTEIPDVLFLKKKKKDLNRVISQSSLQPSCYGKLTPQWNVGTGNYNLWRQRKPDATFNWIDFHSECKYYIYPQFLPDGLSQFQCGFVSWVIHHFALHDL